MQIFQSFYYVAHYQTPFENLCGQCPLHPWRLSVGDNIRAVVVELMSSSENQIDRG